MKALLRAFLLIQAGVYLAFGGLLFSAPFAPIYASLQLPLPQPGFFAQVIGLFMLGWAWLLWQATVDGRLTVAVARVSGHLSWSVAILVPCWLYLPWLSMYASQVGQVFLLCFAGVLLVFALANLRLAKMLKLQDMAEAHISKTAIKQAKVDAKTAKTASSSEARPSAPADSAAIQSATANAPSDTPKPL